MASMDACNVMQQRIPESGFAIDNLVLGRAVMLRLNVSVVGSLQFHVLPRGLDALRD